MAETITHTETVEHIDPQSLVTEDNERSSATWTVITDTGHTLTADTDVELSALWAEHDYGQEWDDDLSPFDEHTIMGEYIDAVHEAKRGQ